MISMGNFKFVKLEPDVFYRLSLFKVRNKFRSFSQAINYLLESPQQQSSQARCHFCGETYPPILVKHHIIPRRLQKKIGIKNDDVIILCANCHKKLHDILDPLVNTIIKLLDESESVPKEKKIEETPEAPKPSIEKEVSERKRGRPKDILIRELILIFLSKRGNKPALVSEIARYLGKKINTTSYIISAMAKEGLVIRETYGRRTYVRLPKKLAKVEEK